MSQSQKVLLFLLRVASGWLFFYAGITKVLNPAWSAEGFLRGAKNFTGFYHWLATPNILPFTNFMNEWGLTILGLSLILGVGVRITSILGAVLMLLYYIPRLDFPYPNPQSYIVDEHIVYALLLIYFAVIRAGRTLGLENWCSNLPLCTKFPKVRKLFG